MLIRFLLAAALPLAPRALAGDSEGLQTLSSAHFNLHCESFYPPAGVLSDLEYLHRKLSLDLILFSPWAKEEKIEVYIYKDSDSYRNRTGAQPWTAGHAQPALRKVFTYESDQLRRVLAHELAHVFFDDFFVSASTVARAPLWLTEGVAVNMEWDYGWEKDNPYARARSKARFQPLAAFLAFDYSSGASETLAVSDWYLQAYSLVRFLLRRFPGNQFFDFCDGLRRGLGLEAALARAYGGRIPDAAALERGWRESLREE